MQKLKTVDAVTLLSTPLPANQFVVERLLPRGLHILAGAKSWLAPPRWGKAGWPSGSACALRKGNRSGV